MADARCHESLALAPPTVGPKSTALPASEPATDAQGDPAVTAALAALTPSQRAAVVLRFYLDLSIQDTARTLGKRPGTVRALTSQGVDSAARTTGNSWLEVAAMNESLKDVMSRAADAVGRAGSQTLAAIEHAPR